MEKRTVFVAAILLAALAAGAQEIPSDFRSEVSDDGFLFAWRIVGTNLEVIMEQQTTGWVAVGFNPTRAMRDANFIIGYVRSDGTVIAEDHFGNRMTAHREDIRLGGESNVTVLDGVEQNGKTTVRFRIPLDSGDTNDQPLTRGETTKILYAWGRPGADNTTSMHAGRGSMTVDL